jgi:RNA 2',3'-cyclic 3'-phosphodiesterase
MHRLFIAYRPPAIIREQLLAIMGDVAGAKWQRDDQLHLTLRYIGAVDGRTAEEIAQMVERFLFTPFDVTLSGVGCFESRDQGQPLWAGVSPEAPLAALHKKLDHMLVRMGLPAEQRRYAPHITVARFGRMKADLSDWLSAYASLSSAPFPLDHISLMESRLGRDGGAYYHDIVKSEGQ